MTAVNTSREAVEALASNLEPVGWEEVCPHCQEYRFPALPDAAAMLRALLDRAERAEEQRRIGHVSLDKLMQEHLEMIARAEAAERDRDAAIREIGNTARHATATARADALREAAAVCARLSAQGASNQSWDEGITCHDAAAIIEDAILALIPTGDKT